CLSGDRRAGHTAGANRGHDRVRFPAAGGRTIDNPATLHTASVESPHACPHATLIEKHQAMRIDTLQSATPTTPLLLDVVTVLFASLKGLLLNVKPACRSARQMVTRLKRNRKRRRSSSS